jgi:hypothetical protein
LTTFRTQQSCHTRLSPSTTPGTGASWPLWFMVCRWCACQAWAQIKASLQDE